MSCGESALVVDGEASESDAEVEDIITSASKAFVVAGEAPESDEEGGKVAPQQRAGGDPAPPPPPPPPRRAYPRSLLHQKLWESNVRLRTSTESVLRGATSVAGARLAQADRMLLSAQESLRSCNANMSLARARLKQVRASLDNSNCSAALPTLRTR